jgi:hypothetical protein
MGVTRAGRFRGRNRVIRDDSREAVVSHQLLIDGANKPGTYQKPLVKVRGYLDELDALPNQGVPIGNRTG